jgi:hypothetical protein
MVRPHLKKKWRKKKEERWEEGLDWGSGSSGTALA